LAGAYNFRDLGGYATADGRATRWGRLFRSDTLHELTPGDVELLAELGLVTILDLRTTVELEATGRGPLGATSIEYHHLSVLPEAGSGSGGSGGSAGGAVADGEADGETVAAPAPAGDDLAERYLWYLDGGRAALARAITVLAEPDRLPAVFHCAAGKDRTGVLAALVLDLVGVGREVIVADYVLTAERMPLIMERYAKDPAFAGRLARTPASRFAVVADTMERFLEGLDLRFGGARGWALDAGVPATTLDRLVGLLVDPAG
jgi:hypothetical protein